MPTNTTPSEEYEATIHRNRRSPGEVARLAAGRKPFCYADWQRQAPPATREELADWEEFLQRRDAERAASLAREAGVDPGTEPA